MTDKTELLANIETSTRERDQISRFDILLKRLVRSLFVAVVVLVFIFCYCLCLSFPWPTFNRTFLTPITQRSFTTIAEKRKLKKNWTLATELLPALKILLLSITVFQSVKQRGISFCIFTGKIFEWQ